VAAKLLARVPAGDAVTRRRLDVRVWLPALVALAVFVPRALPAPPPEPSPRARSIRLPQLHGVPVKAERQRFELDPDASSVRVLVRGPRGRLLVQCERIGGELTIGPAPDDGELILRLDLASLRPLPDPAPGPGVRQVTGVLGDVEVGYRGRLVATTTSDLPGVREDRWLGTIHFGNRVLRQPMQLWRSWLPGRPLRLQGHGTVSGAQLGLPSRTWFGLFQQPHDVTLGLDLAWRRVRDR
jgi:hypothetical protein